MTTNVFDMPENLMIMTMSGERRKRIALMLIVRMGIKMMRMWVMYSDDDDDDDDYDDDDNDDDDDDDDDNDDDDDDDDNDDDDDDDDEKW